MGPSAGSSLTIGFLGSVIGAVGALAAVVLRHKLDTRRQKNKLRSGLLSEMRSTEWLSEENLPELKRQLDKQEPAHSYVPTAVYDRCINQLGLLSESERQKVIDYYSYAHIASEQLSDIDKNGGDTTSLVEGTLDTMLTRREQAIEALENNL